MNTDACDVFTQVERLAKKLKIDIDVPRTTPAAASLLAELRNEEIEQRAKTAQENHDNAIENKHLKDRAAAGREIPQCTRCAERLPPDRSHGLCAECTQVVRKLRAEGKMKRREINYKPRKCGQPECNNVFVPQGARQTKCGFDNCGGNMAENRYRTTKQKLDVVFGIDLLRKDLDHAAAVEQFNKDNDETIRDSQYYAWAAGQNLSSNTHEASKNLSPLEITAQIAGICLTRKLDLKDATAVFMQRNPTCKYISQRAFMNSHRYELPQALQDRLNKHFMELEGKSEEELVDKRAWSKSSPEAIIKAGRVPKELGIEIATNIARVAIMEKVGSEEAIERYYKTNPDKPRISEWTFHNYRKFMPQALQDKVREFVRYPQGKLSGAKAKAKAKAKPKTQPKAEPKMIEQPQDEGLPSLEDIQAAIQAGDPTLVAAVQQMINERKEAIRSEVHALVQQKANELALLGLLANDEAECLAQLLEPTIVKPAAEPAAAEPAAAGDTD